MNIALQTSQGPTTTTTPAPTNQPVPEDVGRRPQWPAWLFRFVLLAWAGFWTWFVALDGFKDGLAKSWPYMLMFLVPIVGFTALTLKWPRVGGASLFAGGVCAAGFMAQRPDWALLFAGPPAVLGAVALWMGWRR